jgi:outer membrane protein assembly factor BamB
VPNAADVSYQPTAPAFPAQPAPQPAAPGAPAPQAGAPVGPYDPQGPGYGYPQPVQSAQPGYPTPQPQPGYPGYATPQPGYQQPGATPNYAYPGAPGVPTATKQRNPVMMFGAIAGTVLAIGIVIGLIVLFSGPSPQPSSSGNPTGGPTGSSTSIPSGAMATLWTAPKSGASGGDNRMIGYWTTSKVIVRGEASALTAYNISDGKVAWTLPAPSGTKAFCSMSAHTNSAGLGAVSFNLGDDDCSAIGAVDAATGTLKFKVGSAGTTKSYNTPLTITDNTIAAASGSVMGGYDVNNGHQSWTYKARGTYCTGNTDAAGTVVVVSDYCADIDPKQELQVLDADSGQVRYSVPLPSENDRLSQIVATTDSMLLVQISSDSDGDYLLGLDTSGKQVAKVPLKLTGEDKMRPSAATAPETKDVVIGTTLYLEVDQNNKTAIRAIDLTSGKVLWTSDGGAAQGLRLIDDITGDGPKVIAINGFDKATQVGALSASDGSFQASASLPQKQTDIMTFSDSEALLGKDGRLLVLDGLAIDHSAVMYGKN